MQSLIFFAALLLISAVCHAGVTAEQRVAANRDDTLSFLLLGDWGKGGSSGAYGSSLDDDEFSISLNPLNNSELASLATDNKDNKKTKTFNQVKVAKAMSEFAAASEPHPSFVIALGDNFYNNGVSSATDKLWDYLWKDIYLTYSSLRIPWYPVFGNHDYGGGDAYVQAQLQRSAEHLDDDLWQFPARNYSRRFAIPGDYNATVQIIFVDTTTLAPSINKCCNENSGVSKEEQTARIEDQLSHIVAALEEAKADPPTWLLVVGHYPVFSAGSNGDAQELQQHLLPLLQEHRVHAYICGHDHISEHLHHKGVEFFVAGAGSMADKLGSAGSAADKLVWAGVGYSAFAYMKASAAALKVGFVDMNGTEVYKFTLTNPLRPFTPPAPEALQPTSSLSLGLVLIGAVGMTVYLIVSRRGSMANAQLLAGKDSDAGSIPPPVGHAGYVQMLKQVATAESSLASMEEGDTSSKLSNKLQTPNTAEEEEEQENYLVAAPMHASTQDGARSASLHRRAYTSYL